MSGSVHAYAAQSAYERAVSEGYGGVVEELQRLIADGFYPAWYLDTLCQPFGGRTPEQVLMFGHLHSLHVLGHVGITSIEVGAVPGSDRDRCGNAAKLHELPGPFRAAVDLGQETDFWGDGSLLWVEPIRTEYGCGCCGGHTVTTAPSGRAALEIGTCPPSRIVMHLDMEGAVARWPYGQNRIYLLVRLTEPDLVIRPPEVDHDGPTFTT